MKSNISPTKVPRDSKSRKKTDPKEVHHQYSWTFDLHVSKNLSHPSLSVKKLIKAQMPTNDMVWLLGEAASNGPDSSPLF